MQKKLFIFPIIIFAVGVAYWVRIASPSIISISTDDIYLPLPHMHEEIGFQPHENHVHFQKEFVAPRDFWIVGFRWKMQNAPVALLHHLRLTAPDQHEYLCPSITKALFARSGEHQGGAFTSTSFPEGYGIPVRRGNQLILEVELSNPLPHQGPGKDYDDVRLTVDLITRASGKGLKSVEITFLRFADPPCHRPPVFTVPPNVEGYIVDSSNFTSTAFFTFPKKAKIIRMGGHFHPWNGGRELTVFVNGKPLHTFRAIRLDPSKEYLWAIPLLEGDPFVAQVNAGDTISYQVKYTNPHPDPITEAMGTFRMYYAYDE